MTRGQNSLTIDLAVSETTSVSDTAMEMVPLADIIVLRADENELAEHESLLDRLDKEVKGSCIWRVSPEN
jgi:DNA polymerase III subunit epsilon